MMIMFGIALSLANVAPAGQPDDPFPEIETKFNSSAESYLMQGEIVDYFGKVQVVLDEGQLYRRGKGTSYDFYFLGSGRLNVIDTSALGIGWADHFGKKRSIEFVSAYICGRRFPEFLMLDPNRWSKAKLNREDWQKLQFKLTMPDRFYWINPSGELGVWPMYDAGMPPIWIDLELKDGDRVMVHMSPDLTEQLNLYYFGLKFERPFLLAGFEIHDRLQLAPIILDSSVISVRLKETGNFEGNCSIYFAEGSDHRGIKLNLPRLFKVDSIINASGTEIPYLKKKERSTLYLGPRPEADDKPDVASIYYRGKFTHNLYVGVDFPIHLTRWFPHLPYRNLGQYRINYTQHKDLTLISVGDKIDDRIEGENRIVSYTTDDISYISFATGLYDTLQSISHDIPINFYIRQENNRGLFNRDIPEKVLADLVDAFSAFYDWYGPPMARSIEMVDQPMSSGQSSPGLIHLSTNTLLLGKNQSRFRAHEMAHQWWGHTVVPKTFKDVWLSEGLAEISAAMYLREVKHDTTEYQDLIDYWRRQVIEEGVIDGLYSRGYRAGSIILGYKFLQSFSPGDYIALVYFKAAYMLEMLRFEMDGPEYRTDFFQQMLGQFVSEFSGKQVTSMDFIRVVAKYIGDQRAAAFFRQWLFRWRIPDIEGSYSIRPDSKGRPMLSLNITTSAVDDDFSTAYPVEIEFGDGTRRLFRIDAASQQQEHLLGPFPQEIKKVSFDPDHIILCRDTKITKSP